ncbi:MAG: methyltransferase domain-containing protein [Gammaproteobacteria bacterium]
MIACDIDKAVLSNPGADEAVVIKPDERLLFADNTFDMIVSDFVFEHIANPEQLLPNLIVS